MSIKGRPYAWFRAALESGDLPQIRAAAAELPVVNLQDALEILPVIAANEPHLYERAACRWLARFALEQAKLEDVLAALTALEQLPNRPTDTSVLSRLAASGTG